MPATRESREFDEEMFFTFLIWWCVGAPVMWRMYAEYSCFLRGDSSWGVPVVAMLTITFLFTVFVANRLFHRLLRKETFIPAWF